MIAVAYAGEVSIAIILSLVIYMSVMLRLNPGKSSTFLIMIPVIATPILIAFPFVLRFLLTLSEEKKGMSDHGTNGTVKKNEIESINNDNKDEDLFEKEIFRNRDLQIAKNMLDHGMSKEYISQFVDLSEEELNQIH